MSKRKAREDMRKLYCAMGLSLILIGWSGLFMSVCIKNIQNFTPTSPCIAVESAEVEILPEDEFIDVPNRTISITTRKFWTLTEIDTFNVIQMSELSEKEQESVGTFINDTMYNNLYTKCVAIEFGTDEEYGGHYYHFVFDDKRYICIYYEEGHKSPLLLYDTILNETMTDMWECI